MGSRAARRDLDRYLEMTREALGARRARSSCGPSRRRRSLRAGPGRGGDAIRRLAREAKATLLIGSDQVEPLKPVAEAKPPAALLQRGVPVQPDGTVGAVYRKMHLVPFGEYVPLKRLLFFVGPIVEAVSDFTPGRRAGAAAGRRAHGEHRDLLRGDLLRA